MVWGVFLGVAAVILLFFRSDDLRVTLFALTLVAYLALIVFLTQTAGGVGLGAGLLPAAFWAWRRYRESVEFRRANPEIETQIRLAEADADEFARLGRGEFR